MELIKVEDKDGEKLVSSRELHKFLEVRTRFNDWFKRMCVYGFEENIDYTMLKIENPNSIDLEAYKIDYIIKLDMAKEISMIQRSEKGKIARKYFIECERKLKKILMPSYQIEDPIERAKSWIKEQEVLKELEYKNKEQEMLLIEHEPKIEYYDSILNSNDLLTITQIAKDYNLSGQALNKILHEEKIQYKQSGQWLLYVNHAVKGYTKSQTIKYFDKEGIERTKLLTKWRQKGRLMIHKLLTDKGIMANMDQ